MTMEVTNVEVWGHDPETNEKYLQSSKYDWRATHCFLNGCKVIYKWEKGATNPPTIISCWEEIHTASVHCEDGWYVIPIRHLADGVISGIQHRELIGTLDGEI